MTMAVTTSRINASRKKAIRKVMFKIIEEKASQLDFATFVQQAVLGTISIDIQMQAKKIYPLKKVEIYKIKVLTSTYEIPIAVPESIVA